MRVVYTVGDFSEVELSANAAEWRAFSDGLTRDHFDFACGQVADPSPYDHVISKIRAIRSPGEKVVFSIDSDDVLVIRGDPALLERIAKTASAFARDFAKGDHLHIDYQGEEHHVGESSIPVILVNEG